MDNSLQTPMEQKPVEIETPQATEPQVKKKKSVLLYVNILLIIIVLGLGAYILKTENFFTEEKKEETVEREDDIEEEDGEEEEMSEEEATTSYFAGKYITATLPLGWNIKEEEDLGSQFKGFQIAHGGKTIMELEILDGVGSVGCPQIVLFSDSPENYEEEMKEMNTEIGMEAAVLDYTNTKYSDIHLFGLRMRRVGNRMFFDTDEKTKAFEAQCEGSWIVIEELSEIASTSYFNLTISNQATAEELNSLDIILESLRLR